MNNSILSRLQDIFREKLEDEDFEISEDLELYDIEEYDSLIHFEIVLDIENVFNVHFTAKEIGNLDSISKIIVMIKEKMKDNERGDE